MREDHELMTQHLPPLRLIANIIAILLTLAILSNDFGILPLPFLRSIALLILLGITLYNIPLQQTAKTFKPKNPLLPSLLLGSALLLSAYLILLLTSTQILWIASIPLLLTGVILTTLAINQPRQELTLPTTAAFFYAIFFLLVQTIPLLWYSLQQTSLFLSRTVGSLSGTPLLLGPSTSGLWIITLLLVFLSTAYLKSATHTKKETIRFIGCTLSTLLIWITSLVIVSVIPISTNTDLIKFTPFIFIAAFIPLLFYLLAGYHAKEPAGMLSVRPYRIKKLLRNGAFWAVLLLFCSSILLTSAIPGENTPSHKPKIVFYTQHMLGTWDIPQYGKYARDGVGMFGLLPVYLAASGYKVELVVDNTTAFLNTTQYNEPNITQPLNILEYVSLIQSTHITNEILRDAKILIIANLNTSFSSEEQTLIWEFVNNGGSLLVMGDHTNVGGMQTPLNDLLQQVGIKFRFDAALPLDDTFKWLTCYELPWNELSASMTNYNQLQFGVGASLDLNADAFPVLIGKYALSDNGNLSASDMAFLGDYTYNQGEQLGDVILAAGAYYGKGKLLVFGDTSSFQNSALPLSEPYLQKIFSWLSSNQSGILQETQLGISLALLFGALLAFVSLKQRSLPFFVFPVALCIALLSTSIINPILIPDTTLSQNLVFIDASHEERFDLEPFTDTSINGFIMNLQRNNYLPVIGTDFSPEEVTASTIAVFIAPTKAFTSEEVHTLRHFMEQGGIVILATGYEEKQASMPLLQELHLDISQVPLGPVPYVESNLTEYQDEPRFVDSWPIQYQQTTGVSYYNFTWGDTQYNLVVFERLGNGGLVLISDSQFLLDNNLESIYDYWPGNILFIKFLLDAVSTPEVKG